MPERMEFDFHFAQPQTREATRPRSDTPMRLLVMGDFTGRGNRGVESPADVAERPLVAVDVDNLEQVLFRFNPRLHLPIGDPAGPSMAVEFKQLDDFHPDRLYQQLDVFQALRETRKRLSDPATFAQAAAELRHEAEQRPAPANKDEEVLAEDDAATFERLLGRGPVSSPDARVAPPAARIDVQKFIKDIVAPYIVPQADPFQDQYVGSVDTAIGAQMRRLLHHPAFQALESVWRGIHWLISNLESGESLKLYLLDITKEELRADIEGAQDNLAASGLYRLLVEQEVGMLGGEGWSVLLGNYTFGTSAADLSLLAALGAIGSQAGGPFVAAADARVLGCRSVAETPDAKDWNRDDSAAEQRWQAVRHCNAASWIGLALPRMLLRLPYGKQTDAIDAFDFEELTPERVHEDYLWGNPVLACALLIGRAFLARGWNMEPGDELEVDDLPAHVYVDEDESKLQACAEAYLSERTADAILERGIMPLVSYQNRNAVRVFRFQSVADPVKPLAGPWG